MKTIEEFKDDISSFITQYTDYLKNENELYDLIQYAGLFKELLNLDNYNDDDDIEATINCISTEHDSIRNNIECILPSDDLVDIFESYANEFEDVLYNLLEEYEEEND